MDDLVDARALELDLPIVLVAEMRESEGIVTAVFWLYGEFAAR